MHSLFLMFNLFSPKRSQKLGCVLYTRAHYTRVNTVCGKESQRVGVMMRLEKRIPSNAKLSLFKSAIMLYLTYCHLTWHFSSATDKRKLQPIQERAMETLKLCLNSVVMNRANQNLSPVCFTWMPLTK